MEEYERLVSDVSIWIGLKKNMDNDVGIFLIINFFYWSMYIKFK